MSAELEQRTKAALKQFDSNMSGIFDRASFYDQDLYSQAAYPQLTRAQLCFKYSLFAANIVFLVSAARALLPLPLLPLVPLLLPLLLLVL